MIRSLYRAVFVTLFSFLGAVWKYCCCNARSAYSDVVNVKRWYEKRRTEVLRDVPAAPLWLHAQPSHFYFSEGLRFDYKSLAFLFEEGQGNLFLKLAQAEKRYFDLAGLFELTSDAAEEVQSKLDAMGDEAKPRWKRMFQRMGMGIRI